MKGADIVNGLIEYVIEQERIAIAKDVEVIIQNRFTKLEQAMTAERAVYQAGKQAKLAELSEADDLKKAQLSNELAALRKQLRTRQDDRIAQLNEAILIAKSLGIKKPSTPSALSEMAQAPTSGNVIRTEVNNQQIPLYFMGSEALEAERAALQVRRLDDFIEQRIAEIQTTLRLLNQNRQIKLLKQREEEGRFIFDYSKWSKETTALKALSLDLNNFQLVNIDQQAIYPRSTFKSRRILMVLITAIVGSIFGVVLVLIRFI